MHSRQPPTLPLASLSLFFLLYLQDFAGGHIKGAINISIINFSSKTKIDELIDGTLSTASRVVLLCTLSKVRQTALGDDEIQASLLT